jgi:hypothetical protein
MSFNSFVRPRNLLASGAAIVAGAAVWLALPDGNAEAAGKAGSTSTSTTAAPTAPVAAKSDKNMNPFGAPTGNGDFKVPPPPEEPTLVPTIATKTTTRLFGSNPFEEAVSVTQHT